MYPPGKTSTETDANLFRSFPRKTFDRPYRVDCPPRTANEIACTLMSDPSVLPSVLAGSTVTEVKKAPRPTRTRVFVFVVRSEMAGARSVNVYATAHRSFNGPNNGDAYNIEHRTIVGGKQKRRNIYRRRKRRSIMTTKNNRQKARAYERKRVGH